MPPPPPAPHALINTEPTLIISFLILCLLLGSLSQSVDDLEKKENHPRCDSVTNTTSFLLKNDIKLFTKTNKSTSNSNILLSNSNEDIDNCAVGPRRKSDTDALNQTASVVSEARQKLLRYGHVESMDNNQKSTQDDDNTIRTNSKNIKNLDKNKNFLGPMRSDELRTSVDSTSSESISESLRHITSSP